MKFIRHLLIFLYINKWGKKISVLFAIVLILIVLRVLIIYWCYVWKFINYNIVSSLFSGFIFSILGALYLSTISAKKEFHSVSIRMRLLIEIELESNLLLIGSIKNILSRGDVILGVDPFNVASFEAVSKTSFIKFLNPEVSSSLVRAYSNFYRLNKNIGDIQSLLYGDKSTLSTSEYMRDILTKKVLNNIDDLELSVKAILTSIKEDYFLSKDLTLNQKIKLGIAGILDLG